MIILRPYQKVVKQQIFDAWASMFRYILLRMPTGSGKTKTFCSLVIDTLQKGLNTAIMVHRKELVQQICLTLAEEGIEHNIIAARKDIKGIIAAERRLFKRQFYNPSSKVTVISVDTIISRFEHYKEWGETIHQWIVDEAGHVLKTNKWGRATTIFPNARGLGVTATPERLDRKGLGSHADGVFDFMVEGPETKWLIDQGYLSKYKIALPHSDYENFLKETKGNSDYSRSALAAASKQSAIVGDVVDSYIKHANGKQAILFATDVNTAKQMEKKFLESGIAAKSLDAKTPDKLRLDTIIDFRKKKIKVLINVDLFDEGLDVPGIECVIMARPTKSLGKFLQMCLDSQTEILTKRGWLRFFNIERTDKVAAFNIENEEIEWCEVQDIIIRERNPNELMFNYNSPQLDIRITSQHDMIVRSRHSKNWKKEIVDEACTRKDTFHVPVNGTERKQSANITNAELSFLGWFLSDGTRVKNSYTEIITISQCSNNEYNLDHIRNTLRACNFKFSEYLTKRTGELSHYADLVQFTIMKDKPKRNFKGWEGLRGWKDLSEWLDKSIPSIYNSLTRAQTHVMINSFFLGDGTKKRNVDYTPRTMTITAGDNRQQADRLQSLLVTRGYRCSLHEEDRTHSNRKNIYMLNIKNVGTSSVSGVNCKDGSISGKKPYKRTRFIKETEYKKEVVWCVKNRLGTLVTRRNGKVAVLGNCGRGLRVADGKPYLILIDHVGNIMGRHGKTGHGLPDKVRRWTLDRIRKSREKLNFLRICSNITCCAPYDRALTECPWCGTTAVVVSHDSTGKVPPEFVDGDLFLIDPETIRMLEAQTQLESPADIGKRVGSAINAAAGMSAMKKQAERIKTQKVLSEAIALWAGQMRHYYAYSDRMIHKKFYLHHNMTITEALGQTRAEMDRTIEELNYGEY